MEIQQQHASSRGIKFVIQKEGVDIGRAFLYIFENGLGRNLVGYLEDVFINEDFRKEGYGRQLIENVIDEAKKQGCYKIFATSRYGREKLHNYYQKFGFKDHGKSFRLDF